MALPYISVALSALEVSRGSQQQDQPPAIGDLFVRCSVVDKDGSAIENVWRKSHVLTQGQVASGESDDAAAGRSRVGTPAKRQVVKHTLTLDYNQNSSAVDLNVDTLNQLSTGFLRIEVVGTDSEVASDADGVEGPSPLASALVALAPFVTSKALQNSAHDIPLIAPDESPLKDVSVSAAIKFSAALWRYCRRSNLVAIQQVLVQNLPEEWNATASQAEYTVTLTVPTNKAASEDGTNEAQETASGVQIPLQPAQLVDGTLAWSPSELTESAVHLGKSADETTPLATLFLDLKETSKFRSAVLEGAGLSVQLERFGPDPKTKKGKEPQLVADPTASCTAVLPLNGSSNVTDDSLVENGATSVAAAVPLEPQNGNAEHPVAVAQSAVFVVVKLAKPLAASQGARVTGGLSVASVLGASPQSDSGEEQVPTTDRSPPETKFSSVQESKLVVRRYLAETLRVVLATHQSQFSGKGATAPLASQKTTVAEALEACGYGGLIREKLKYALVGLLREKFRANQLQLDNARQASTALIDLCSYLEQEVENSLNNASANLRSSSRSGQALSPLLVLGYDAYNDGNISRALRFHRQHVSSIADSDANQEQVLPSSDHAVAWAELGRCHIRESRFLEGSVALQEALALDPTCVSGASSFAAVLLQRQLHASVKAATSSDLARAFEFLTDAMGNPPSSEDTGLAPNHADRLYQLALAIRRHQQGEPLPPGNSSDQDEVASHLLAVRFILDLNLGPLARASLDALASLVAKLPRQAHRGAELRISFTAFEMWEAYLGERDEDVVGQATKLFSRLRNRAEAEAEAEAETTSEADDEKADDAAASGAPMSGDKDDAAVGDADGAKVDEPDVKAKVVEVRDQDLCEDSCFWRILAQSQVRLGRTTDALASFDRCLECVDESLNWDEGRVPSRVRVLLAVGDLCSEPAPSGLGDPERALQYFKTAATLGACPGVWFRLGQACVALGKFADAEDAFAKVTAMDNSHSVVWAEMAKLCLQVVPPRLSDAQIYLDQVFTTSIDSRASLNGLADAFLSVSKQVAGDASAVETANACADRCLRQSLAFGEDAAIRSKLRDLLRSADDREACDMYLSPRRGPQIAE